MKRILVGIMIFTAGFVGGLIVFLKILTRCSSTLHGFKEGLIDDIEYLLLGYNTVKGARKCRYQPFYYRRRPYSGFYTTYRDYYGDKSFEEDEKEED